MSHPKTENERLLLSTNFMEKCELIFVLTPENAFLQRFFKNPTERAYVSLKNHHQQFLK